MVARASARRTCGHNVHASGHVPARARRRDAPSHAVCQLPLPRCTLKYHVARCNSTLRVAIPRCALQYHVARCNTTLHVAIARCALQYHVARRNTTCHSVVCEPCRMARACCMLRGRPRLNPLHHASPLQCSTIAPAVAPQRCPLQHSAARCSAARRVAAQHAPSRSARRRSPARWQCS